MSVYVCVCVLSKHKRHHTSLFLSVLKWLGRLTSGLSCWWYWLPCTCRASCDEKVGKDSVFRDRWETISGGGSLRTSPNDGLWGVDAAMTQNWQLLRVLLPTCASHPPHSTRSLFLCPSLSLPPVKISWLPSHYLHPTKCIILASFLNLNFIKDIFW